MSNNLHLKYSTHFLLLRKKIVLLWKKKWPVVYGWIILEAVTR